MPGPLNMAIDEAILHSVAEGGPPTLRFYGWEPPAISIGYFQELSAELDLAACKSLGIDVVKRPTGGRAVLHDVEVTYSLVISENDPIIPRGITESYRTISEGMVLGLTKLGLEAKMVSLSQKRANQAAAATESPGDSKERSSENSTIRSNRYRLMTIEVPDRRAAATVCFDAPSWYEVTVDGKKVVGSAQMRRRGVLLQHGSIPLELDAEKLFACLRVPSEAVRTRLKESFLSRATSIRAALGRPVSFMETCEAIKEGLEEALGVSIVEGELTPAERAKANELLQTKYHVGGGQTALSDETKVGNMWV